MALLQRFQQNEPDDALLPPPIIYRDSLYGVDRHNHLNFELRLDSKPLALEHRVVKLDKHGYPVSYSVVFQNCLVALFKSGSFGCYRLPDLTPDEQLERQLNGGGWERCWLIGEQLVAQNNRGTYAYGAAAHAWQPYEALVPFGQQPKLYEDARYLAYADCQGEFGGTAYFSINKPGKRTA